MCLGVSKLNSENSDKIVKTLLIPLKLIDVSNFKTMTICIIYVEKV